MFDSIESWNIVFPDFLECLEYFCLHYFVFNPFISLLSIMIDISEVILSITNKVNVCELRGNLLFNSKTAKGSFSIRHKLVSNDFRVFFWNWFRILRLFLCGLAYLFSYTVDVENFSSWFSNINQGPLITEVLV